MEVEAMKTLTWGTIRFRTDDLLVHWRETVVSESQDWRRLTPNQPSPIRIGLACTMSQSGGSPIVTAELMSDDAPITCLRCVLGRPRSWSVV